MKLFAFPLLVLLGVSMGGCPATNSYRTEAVKYDDMMPTISATGTAEPEETIDVGAQVAGLIKSLGKDPTNPNKTIDYGSEVVPDTVLALIDDSVYKAQLESASASLAKSKATLIQLKATLAKANADLKRGKELMEKNAMAQGDYDSAVAAQAVAAANVDVGAAAIEQDRAALSLAQTNLGYTVIKAPVKGIVIDRRVNVGQTVVSALNAPSLFLLAKDLRRMQVWASVNEADIGKIHKGQPVHFTVDAYPTETFVGIVDQIRLNATMTQNVVTYTVVVATDNTSLKLLPYMTTNVQFELERHDHVLVVPNAALRWKPKKTQIAPEFTDAAARSAGKHHAKDGDDAQTGESKDSAPGDVSKDSAAKGTAATDAVAKDSAASPEDAAHGNSEASKDGAVASTTPSKTGHKHQHGDGKKDHHGAGKSHAQVDWGRVWAKQGNFVRPVDVKIIATDGSATEVSGKDVQEDMEVVVGEDVAADDSAETTSPFAPKMFRKK